MRLVDHRGHRAGLRGRGRTGGEGWILTWVYPILVLANLIGRESRLLNAVGFSAVFLLLLSLTGKKLRQPLLSSCSTNVCGLPEKKNP